ncbi:MAG: hypothetical protein D9V47_13810 [Clostridia bacterium]|nr:MAG: hypothetical protein D9V47_13810 [Clostridia bacterium]
MLTKVLLHEIGEKLLAKEKYGGIVCVTDRVSPPGLYGEEPPIPEGHLRVHLGAEFVDVPREGAEEWLAEHVDEAALVIWVVAGAYIGP